MRKDICKYCAENFEFEEKSIGILTKGKCFVCQKEFEGMDLKAVYEYELKNNSPYICINCSKQFKDSEFESASYVSGKHKCDVCKLEFGTIDLMVGVFRGCF